AYLAALRPRNPAVADANDFYLALRLTMDDGAVPEPWRAVRSVAELVSDRGSHGARLAREPSSAGLEGNCWAGRQRTPFGGTPDPAPVDAIHPDARFRRAFFGVRVLALAAIRRPGFFSPALLSGRPNCWT